MTPALVVGIAGGSGSGKSAVVDALIEGLAPEPVARLSHDRYYRDLTGLSAEARSRENFDHPAALETALLVRHLDELRAGRAVAMEKYVWDSERFLGEYVFGEETERRRDGETA